MAARRATGLLLPSSAWWGAVLRWLHAPRQRPLPLAMVRSCITCAEVAGSMGPCGGWSGLRYARTARQIRALGLLLGLLGRGMGIGWLGGWGFYYPRPFPPAIFLPPAWAGFRGGVGRICLLLAGFTSSGGGQPLRRASCSASLTTFCLCGRVEDVFLCLHVRRGHPSCAQWHSRSAGTPLVSPALFFGNSFLCRGSNGQW